ncbi:hypothetical protein CDAR_101451 [Caerostris darwini]|uniref:Maturase K n=1 Tax=Caerostris darwini TaxID=1538125 RepID=A0AAV4W4A4_9ARAC|nr:hypothetical protein CDAR_101451 [Caerostris darwini]
MYCVLIDSSFHHLSTNFTIPRLSVHKTSRHSLLESRGVLWMDSDNRNHTKYRIPGLLLPDFLFSLHYSPFRAENAVGQARQRAIRDVFLDLPDIKSREHSYIIDRDVVCLAALPFRRCGKEWCDEGKMNYASRLTSSASADP